MKKQILLFLLFLMPFLAHSQCTTNNATGCSCKDGSTNCELLPDIYVGKPPLLVNGTSGYVEYAQTCNPPCSGNDGRLRLSVTTPNGGFGPLEVRALPTAICGTDTFYNVASNFVCPNGQALKQLVVQRVYRKNGNAMTFTDRTAGTMTYHPSHGHMHVDDWGIYTLRTATADPNPLNWPILGTGSKLAFCLMDYGSCSTYNGHCVDSLGNTLLNSNFPNYSLGGGNYGCSPTVQGISSGFTDIYYQNLDGMWINLPPGLCNGQYWIVVQLDPYNYFLESNENNNVIAVPITLTKQSGTLPTITANGATTFCQGGSVTLTSTAATNYLWSNGATTQSITVNQTGTYSVTVGGSGCSATSLPISITVTPVTVNASATPTAVCLGQTVQLGATATSVGSTNQVVTLNNTTSLAIPDNNPTGASSTITISNINPITLGANTIVSVSLNISHTYDSDLLIQLISPSGSTINLCNRRGGSNDNFTNTVFTSTAANTIASGSSPFTGSYRPEAAFSALTGNSNGVWTLKVIDQDASDVGTLLNWSLSINNSLPTTLSYVWTSNPTGLNATGATTSTIPTQATSYIVTVTESGTGCVGSATVPVTISPNLSLSVNSTGDICPGGTATLTATGADNYAWSPATSLNTTNVAQVLASPTQATTYTVSGTDANGCSGSTTFTVNMGSPIQITTNTPDPICLGSSSTIIANGATSYVWYPATDLNTAQGSSVISTPTSPIQYTVVGTNLNGCTGSAIVNIDIASNLIITTNTPNTICVGTSVGINANGADDYTWSPTTGLDVTTGSSVNASPAQTTIYTVTGTNVAGCSGSTTVTVNTNEIPVISTSIIGNTTLCIGSSQTYSIAPVNNTDTYTWTVPTGTTITSGQGTNSIIINSAASGEICVTANNSCGSSISKCMTINVASSIPSIPGGVGGSATACPGDQITYSITAINGASSYIWTNPANTTILSGQGTNSLLLQYNQGFIGGDLFVKSVNICGVSANRKKTITPKIPSTPSSINGNSLNLCNATNVAYSTPNVNGITYNWTVPTGATIISGQGTNAISVNFSNLFISGNISVIATNSCGNSSVARTKSVKAATANPTSITGSTSLCVNQSGVVFSTPAIVGATSYNWTVPSGSVITAGQGTNSITVKMGSLPKTGNVIVTVSNACATSTRKLLVVTINACNKISDALIPSINNIALAPNPATEYVQLTFNTDRGNNGKINITNILGQVTVSQTITCEKGINDYMIDLRNIPAGVYVLSVEQDNRKFTKRLIIE